MDRPPARHDQLGPDPAPPRPRRGTILPLPALPAARALLVALALLVAGCGGLLPATERPSAPVAYQPVAAKGYPADGVLVDADWVAARQDDPTVRVVDLSPARRYQRGHLPGAHHLWWQDLIEIDNTVYGMLAGPPRRAALLGGLGIGPETTVVAYDDEGGVWASRLVWLLDYLGHERVHLLDGGPQAWVASGRTLTTAAPPPPPPATFVEHLQPQRLLHADEVGPLVAGGGALVDGRTHAERAETWLGRLRLGQVPGALALPWTDALAAPAGPFLPADALRQRLAPLLAGGGPVAVHGQFGAAAALHYVALRALGRSDVALYDGSWAEWGADPARPLAPAP